jgi:integrase
MAKAKTTLTDAAVQRIKLPEKGKQTDWFDPTYPGLSLRVSWKGRKTWNYVYRIGGKPRRMTLDVYPRMTVAEAHEEWRKKSKLVRDGIDPGAKAASGGATDFRGVFEEWMQRDQGGNRSAGDVRRHLEKNVLPLWQARQIDGITRRDVLDVIDAIVDRDAVILARRIHSYLHRLFKWALGRGIIERNPIDGVEKPGSETRRDRVLTDAELVKVWNAADQVGAPYGNAIKLLILTGARREEIGALKWAEVEHDVVNLDGMRTKNGEPHTIPLSTPAMSVLQDTPRILDCDFAFTNNGKGPVANWGRVKTRLDAIAKIKPWTIHDLRRTMATGLQKLGTPLQVTEACLNHTSGSRAGVVGIYQRHDFANEKRSALEAWGAHVMALVDGTIRGKVVAMRR